MDGHLVERKSLIDDGAAETVRLEAQIEEMKAEIERLIERLKKKSHRASENKNKALCAGREKGTPGGRFALTKQEAAP